MQFIYEGTDITEHMEIRGCVHRDLSGGRADSLELVVGNAAKWFAWGPKRDDKVLVSHNGYDTGTLFISMILPEEGRYRLIATATPSAVRRKAYGTYENITLAGLMRACAAECGMDWALFGLEGSIRYPFLLRKDEGVTAFLQRVLEMEGATLKCLNGKLVAIGIEYAQEQKAGQNIEIQSATPGFFYRQRGGRWDSVTVMSPYGEGRAVDTAADTLESRIYTDLPAHDSLSAGRWARGLLLCHNRRAEEMEFVTPYNPGMTALARVDVTSVTDAAGEWVIDEAQHDFFKGSTKVKMVRKITSIS
ncbi:MAG: hypothetical protein GXY67_07915 [Clostridiales bacterium]|nr:hypothetical protein [Clostridiales bacterium]